MADRAAPLAALQHRIDDAGFVGATLATVPFLAQVGVRLDPSGPAAARVEAALGFGWERHLGARGAFVGMSGFGASAPAPDLYRHFGITPEAVAEAAAALV